jgi:hypothetical protein
MHAYLCVFGGRFQSLIFGVFFLYCLRALGNCFERSLHAASHSQIGRLACTVAICSCTFFYLGSLGISPWGYGSGNLTYSSNLFFDTAAWQNFWMTYPSIVDIWQLDYCHSAWSLNCLGRIEPLYIINPVS